ncbi:MAG TPA: hypothetical protein PLJ25_04855 [Methanothrix sp.]|nr:hypothetical protein [Methanothrix sp.]
MLAKAVFVALIALIAVSALSACPVVASPSGLIGSSFSSSVPGMDRMNGNMDGKMDQMISEAMQRIDSIKQRQKEQMSGADTALSLPKNNSTLQNSTLQNSTLQNSTFQNSIENSTPLNSTQDNSIGSGSRNRFNGLYAVSASRHEMGKSGVESKMVLNGTFEMDKSVKFQDQGF